MNAPSVPPSTPAIFKAFASPSLWKTVAVGGLGGFVGFALDEPLYSTIDHTTSQNIVSTLLLGAAPIIFVASALGMALLIFDNVSSLRGKWHRDLGLGTILFIFLGIASGITAEIFFGVGMHLLNPQNDSLSGLNSTPSLPALMLIRGLAWMVFGAGVGSSIGILRSDKGQILRGALGGAIGGFLGGALFDPIYFALHDNGTGVTSRALGFTILGCVLGAATRLVQETLKSAWLLGISTGPYEGKEYPLGKARLTVGRGSNCDLSLFRDEALAPQLGALVFQGGQWWWQGETISINGVPQNNAPLIPGARLQIGSTQFRFNDRSKTAPRDPLAPSYSTPQAPFIASAVPTPVAAAAPIPVAPVAPTPIAWTFSPAVGNAQTGFRLSPETGTATIGRVAGNDWQISDDGTSSRHARLERTFDGLALTDLASTNGTFINGQKMAPNIAVALVGGETIRIGRTQWMVRRG